MKETFMQRQGYNYHVYVGPGVIQYFEDIDRALEYAKEVGAVVQKMW